MIDLNFIGENLRKEEESVLMEDKIFLKKQSEIKIGDVEDLKGERIREKKIEKSYVERMD